jgi:hypothetical protein
MNRVIPILLVLVAIAVAITLAWLYLTLSFPGGAGAASSEQRALPPFRRVVIEGLADVTLVAGSAESLTLEGHAKQLPRVLAQVSDGTLTIANGGSRRWWSDLFGGGVRPVRMTLTYRDIDGIAAAGAVKLRADHLRTDRLKVSLAGATSLKILDLDTKDLSVSGSGAMKAEVAGRAVDQRIDISGAGDYRAAELASIDARVSVSGAGRVVVRVEKTLRIGLSGAGNVEYIGNPKVTQEISGAGRVKRRDAAVPSGLVVAHRAL